MALPKKKKRLAEAPETGPAASALSSESAAADPVHVSGKSADTAIHEQMEKAFELVDTIEQEHPVSGSADRNHAGQSAAYPEAVRIQFGVKTPDAADESTPVIAVNLKIPSFLWKFPILGGVTRNIIRKLAKD